MPTVRPVNSNLVLRQYSKVASVFSSGQTERRVHVTTEAVDAAKEGAQVAEKKGEKKPRQSKLSGAQKKMIGRVAEDGDARRTVIAEAAENLDMVDLIAEEEVIVTVSVPANQSSGITSCFIAPARVPVLVKIW